MCNLHNVNTSFSCFKVTIQNSYDYLNLSYIHIVLEKFELSMENSPIGTFLTHNN